MMVLPDPGVVSDEICKTFAHTVGLDGRFISNTG